MRTLVLVLLLTFLSGCSAVTKDAYDSVLLAFQTPEDVRLDQAQIQAMPYSAVYVRRPDRAQALVVMGFVDGEGDQQRISWLSQSGQTIVTRHGRVIRTQGMSDNLLDVTNLQNDPLLCFSRMTSFADIDCAREWEYRQDFSQSGRHQTLPFTAEISMSRPQTIELSEVTYDVILVEERIYSAKSVFLGTNKFWLEEDGHVVKSEQHILPGETATIISQVKWVGR